MLRSIALFLVFFLPAASLADAYCPAGTVTQGHAPPEGFELWCERKNASGQFVKHGWRRGWHPSGKAKFVAEFRDGTLDGFEVEWDEKGKKLAVREWASGKLVTSKLKGTACPDKGELLGGRPPNGLEEWCAVQDDAANFVRHGPARSWHSNAAKKTEHVYRHGVLHGQAVSWFENGRIEEEGGYRNGQKQGPWIAWYATGMKRAEGFYWDGRRVGAWQMWDTSGKRSEQLFDDSKADSAATSAPTSSTAPLAVAVPTSPPSPPSPAAPIEPALAPVVLPAPPALAPSTSTAAKATTAVVPAPAGPVETAGPEKTEPDAAADPTATVTTVESPATSSLCAKRAAMRGSSNRSQVMPIYLAPMVVNPEATIAPERAALVPLEVAEILKASLPLKRFATHLGTARLDYSTLVAKADVSPSVVLQQTSVPDAQQFACSDLLLVPALDKYEAKKITTERKDSKGKKTTSEGWQVSLAVSVFVYRVEGDQLRFVDTVDASVPGFLDMVTDLTEATQAALAGPLEKAGANVWSTERVLSMMDHISSIPDDVTKCAASTTLGDLDIKKLRAGNLPALAQECVNSVGAVGESPKRRASARLASLEQCKVTPPTNLEELYVCELRRRTDQAARGLQVALRGVKPFRLFSPALVTEEEELESELGSKEGVAVNDGYWVIEPALDDGEDNYVGYAKVDETVEAGAANGAAAATPSRTKLHLVYGDAGTAAESGRYRLMEDPRLGLSLELGGAIVSVLNDPAFLLPSPDGEERRTNGRDSGAYAASVGVLYDLSSVTGIRDLWEINYFDYAFTQDLTVFQILLGTEKRFHLFSRTSFFFGIVGSAANVSFGTGTETTTETTSTSTDEASGKSSTEKSSSTAEDSASAWLFGTTAFGGFHFTVTPAIYLRTRVGYRYYFSEADEFKSGDTVVALPYQQDFSVSLSGPSAEAYLGYNF